MGQQRDTFEGPYEASGERTNLNLNFTSLRKKQFLLTFKYLKFDKPAFYLLKVLF